MLSYFTDKVNNFNKETQRYKGYIISNNINQLFKKEEKKLVKTFEKLRLNKYKQQLIEIIPDVTNELKRKKELTIIYRWFNKLIMAKIDIRTAFNIIRFFYEERMNHNYYQVDIILDTFIKINFE